MRAQLPRGRSMPQYDVHIGELYLEVVYSDLDGWLAWSCVARRDGKILGSLGGTEERDQRLCKAWRRPFVFLAHACLCEFSVRQVQRIINAEVPILTMTSPGQISP
jgi:hypothetical protein